MKTSDFYFDLPKELIAQRPLEQRSESRLLCLDKTSGEIQHKQFSDILDMLNPGDLLVMNDTRVMPARLFGSKETGGKVEILIERILDDNEALAHVGSNRSPKPGHIIDVEGFKVEMLDREGALFKLKFLSDESIEEVLAKVGHIPLPHYMERPDDEQDWERYQTVYSDQSKARAVAAPTAGLHFDEALLEKIKQKGIETAFVTLHVGAGTFQPVKVDDVNEHTMHSEYIEVTSEVVEKIGQVRQQGGRVVAVGTTTVRSLETAARDGELKPFFGDTAIFIYPGFQFNAIDALITNFHLPESTLIMLVSALAGKEEILNAYNVAVQEGYRFFSYGDAMFISDLAPK